MKSLFFVLFLGLVACDVKVKSNTPVDPPKPKPTCARSLTKDIPQAFQSSGIAVAASKTERLRDNCRRT